MSQNGLTVIQESRDLITFDREKIDLIKQTVAEGTTDQQLALFLHQAQRTGLDPLSKQIHCVLRWDNKSGTKKMSIQTAIDGYRLIADRTGKYAGSDDYLFNEDLTQYQHLVTGEGQPVTATVTVYKLVGGHRVPFTATAQWDAYFPGDKQGFMWRKMPYLMLGKCAEALALRKAFPAELSGMYVREEMEQDVFVDETHEETVEGEVVDDQPPPPTVKASNNGTMPDDEKAIYASANNFMRTAIVEIARYPTIDAVKGALKKLGYTSISGDKDERLETYLNLKAYARLRDSGMDSDAAVDAIVNEEE